MKTEMPIETDIIYSYSSNKGHWSSGTIQFKGNIFNISDGETTNKFIFWNEKIKNTKFQTTNNLDEIIENHGWIMAIIDHDTKMIHPATEFVCIYTGSPTIDNIIDLSKIKIYLKM